jgi:hypothetical protein
VIVSSADGRLLHREPDGTLVAHADLGQPGWQDIVADGRGNVYVNRAGFPDGRGGVSTWRRLRGRDGRLGTPGGRGHRVRNGMAVTADNSTLIVTDSYRHSRVAFDIGSDSGRPTDTSGPNWARVCRRASAWTCRRLSGTPTCPTSGSCASPRAGRRRRWSSRTTVASPARWAGPAGRCCSSWPANGGHDGVRDGDARHRRGVRHPGRRAERPVVMSGSGSRPRHAASRRLMPGRDVPGPGVFAGLAGGPARGFADLLDSFQRRRDVGPDGSIVRSCTARGRAARDRAARRGDSVEEECEPDLEGLLGL